MTPAQPTPLRAARVAARLAAAAAASKLGVSRDYLLRLERGAVPLTEKLARRAAALYGGADGGIRIDRFYARVHPPGRASGRGTRPIRPARSASRRRPRG